MIFTLTNVVASFNFLGKKRIYTAFPLCVNRGVKGKIAGENRVLSPRYRGKSFAFHFILLPRIHEHSTPPYI